MRAFKILIVIAVITALTSTIYLIAVGGSMWPARSARAATTKTKEGPISLKGGYWGDAETPEYFLLWDFWFYEKPSVWAPNSWIPFDRYTGNVHIGSGVVSATAVPARSRLSFTDDIDFMADIQLNDNRLNVSGTVFAVDARKEVNGVLHWSVNGMAKRLWRLEARVRELEILMEAR